MTENADVGLPPEWQNGLINWAQRVGAVRELWLFGSRAKGTARADSDVDIAIALMPAVGKHDWALGDYFALKSTWRHDLEAIVKCHVSLEAIALGSQGDIEVRTTGICLWKRAS